MRYRLHYPFGSLLSELTPFLLHNLRSVLQQQFHEQFGLLDGPCEEYFENGKAGVNIRISSTEMGQGTMTIMPQIASDGLRINMDQVNCPFPVFWTLVTTFPALASQSILTTAEPLRRCEQIRPDTVEGGAEGRSEAPHAALNLVEY